MCIPIFQQYPKFRIVQYVPDENWNIPIFRNIPKKTGFGYVPDIFWDIPKNSHIPNYRHMDMSQIKFGIFRDIPWKMEYSRIWLKLYVPDLKWNIPKISNENSMSRGRVKFNQADWLVSVRCLTCQMFTIPLLYSYSFCYSFNPSKNKK